MGLLFFLNNFLQVSGFKGVNSRFVEFDSPQPPAHVHERNFFEDEVTEG